MRPWTLDRRNEDGSKTVRTKRCCNGCGAVLGDVSEAEIDAGIAGRPLPDVRGECPNCCSEDGADDRLLKPGEVAALFRVDPRTATRWAKAGRLSSIRTPGGHRRFKESEVRALLDGDAGVSGG